MTEARRDRLLSPLMLGVASGSILVPLNSTMLAVALPGVMDEFGLGADAVSSLVSLYLGAVAVALPVSGSLGDRFGHRRLFLAGVVVFGIASLVAVGAGSFLLLQVARVLQAVSGAFVSTSSAALIREAAPPSRRGEAFGIFDLLVSTSAAAGPFVGGLLVGAFGWRSLFVVAVPVAALAAAAVGFWLRPAPGVDPPRPHGTHRPLDPVGLALLGAGIVAILIALRPPAPWVAAVAALAIVPLLFAFVRFELGRDHPAIDPRLFASRPFSAAIAGVFGNTVVLHGCFLIVPLLVERLLGESATTSGLVLLGISGVGAIVAPLAGRTSDRLGRRLPVVVGSFVIVGALLALAVPAGAASVVAVGLLLAVVGLGMGLSGSARQAAALEAIGPDRVGMAAGTYYTGRYLGGVVGASLAGAVLASGVTPGGVSLGFGVLAVVMALGAIASLGLPGQAAGARRGPAEIRRSDRIMITFRPMNPSDSRAVHEIFFESIAEVDRRLGSADAVAPGDTAAKEADWVYRRSLFEHLAATSDMGWLAERDGLVIGYARSILRDGSRELTEFFVRPGHQGAGVGRDLIGRAFPAETGVHRTIIATQELPALIRYLSSGLAVQTLIGFFGRPAQAMSVASDLVPERVGATPAVLDAMASLDIACLGHRRDEDLHWLLSERDGYLYRRAGAVAGYGFTGRRSGPFAARDPGDLPAMLAHAETAAAAAGVESFDVAVPFTNLAATGYLIANRFRLDPFLACLFADAPLPSTDRYVITSPPFFL